MLMRGGEQGVIQPVCVRAYAHALTFHGLGVDSFRVVEPIRPLFYLHPPAWADPESARRRRLPPKKACTLSMVTDRGQCG